MNATPRTFTRLDLALLALAATCGGFAVDASDREFLDIRQRGVTASYAGTPYTLIPASPLVGFEAYASRTVQDLVAALYGSAPWLALVAYRQGPRRGILPRRRGPGHVALAIVGGLIAFGLVHYVWFIHGPTKLTGYQPVTTAGGTHVFWFYFAQTGSGPTFAYAITAGWIYMAAVGAWRKPSLPLERAGRWLGLAWIVASVAAWGLSFPWK